MFSFCLGLLLVSIEHYKFRIIRAQNQEKQTLIRFLFFPFLIDDTEYKTQSATMTQSLCIKYYVFALLALL